MLRRVNIKQKSAGLVRLCLLVVALCLSACPPAAANVILCGDTKCDLSTRICVRGGKGHEVATCTNKSDISAGDVEFKSSVKSDGTAYLPNDAAEKIKKAKTAPLSSYEQKMVQDYYKDKEQVDISAEAKSILQKAKAKEEAAEKKTIVEDLLSEDDTQDVIESVNMLSKYTKEEGFNSIKVKETSTATMYGNDIAKQYEEALEDLEDIYKDGYLTDEEFKRLQAEIIKLQEVANSRAAEASKMLGKEVQAKAVQESVAEVTEEYKTSNCPTTAQVKARFGAGCWSCLVIERLTSAFLHAANAGLAVTQKAGMVLLLLGSMIWLAFWALKNVSSFTQLQLGNLMNDLLKFGFKFLLAYWFIVFGATAISKYFITPIMSVGALMGQEFWDEKTKIYTEAWDTITDDDMKYLEEELQKEAAKKTTPLPDASQAQTQTQITLTPEEKAYDEEVTKQNEDVFSQTEIPNLLIPGLQGGRLTSLFGCRPRPCSGCSAAHMGVDVAPQTSAPCTPVIAAGPGKISYKTQRSKSGKVTGYGYYAIITHDTKDGNIWQTYYAHMKMNSGPIPSGSRVRQGEKIGCVGNTGVGTGAHLHFGVRFEGTINKRKFSGVYVDPLSLPAKKVCSITKAQCDGKHRKICESSIIQKNPPRGLSIPKEGWPAAGQAVGLLSSASNTTDVGGGDITDYDALIVDIPQDIKYTGPTNIMPKSVMNSILGAVRAITNETANVMVLGDIIMCYATSGGAWNIEAFGITLATIPNIFMWIEGVIVFCMGFMLVLSLSYYLVDISFKIGFAVLAFPVVMGLWPFDLTKGKLYVIISVIAKSAALFAGLAIMVHFGMQLVSEAVTVGGLEELYEKIDLVEDKNNSLSDSEEDELRTEINDVFSIFSTTFIMLLFALIYFFKLIQKASSDLVNKFFPDGAFGDSSPMHSAATMMTSWTKNLAMKATGLNYAKDFVAYQTGNLAKKGVQKAGSALAHPMRTARGIGRGAAAAGRAVGRAGRFVGNKLRGK